MFSREGPTFMELARQALSSTEKGYDLLAPKFDATPFRTPDELMLPALDVLGPCDRALDVCCGTGAAARLLRARAREQVVGVDFSAGMLAEAARRTKAAPGPARMSFVRADVLEMPFAPVFDAAVCFGALGHFTLPVQPRFARQVFSALRPGGRFVIVTAEDPGPSTLRWWLAKGFNAAMHVRNAIWKPEFVMFYLTFMLPEVRTLFEGAGFRVDVASPKFPHPFGGAKVVVATKP